MGHFGASLALKGYEKNASLGVLFLGVQFVDLIMTPLVLLGIERFNIVPNYTASTHIELVYYPYTHSLLSAFVWAFIAYLAFRFLILKESRNRNRIALVVAVAVASHWFFDLIVHTPDLPLLTDSSLKVGFGLWNNAPATYILETVLLAAGLFIYLKSTKVASKGGKFGMIIFVGVLILFSINFVFGPPPEFGIAVMTIFLFVFYIILSSIAFWLDRKRS